MRLPRARAISSTPLTAAARAALDVRPREIVRRWLDALSPSPQRAYRLALQRFARWSLKDPDAPAEDAVRMLCRVGCGSAHELVIRWRDGLLATGLAPASVGVMVTSVSSVLKVCRRLGLITWRLEGVLPRLERREDRSGPSRLEVDRMLRVLDAAAKAGDDRAARDRAIVRLLFGAALRRAEVTGLRFPEDVALDRPDGAAVRPRRKAARERQWVLVPKRAEQSLRVWLRIRGSEPGAVFHRLASAGAVVGELSGETVRRVVHEWATRAGLTCRVRPHGLRHAAATHVAREGSLDELMSLGGWSSFAAARAYLDDRSEQRRRALARVDA